MPNPHKHTCQSNKTLEASCISCKWERWQAEASRQPEPARAQNLTVSLSFAERMTPSDKTYLSSLGISWGEAEPESKPLRTPEPHVTFNLNPDEPLLRY
jgi:hypothetical protein